MGLEAGVPGAIHPRETNPSAEGRPRRTTMRDVPGSLAVLRELASYPTG